MDDRIARLVGDLDQMQGRIRRLRAELDTLETTVESNDTLVAVTMRADGSLAGIRLAPDVYRAYEPADLAGTITILASLASARLGDALAERYQRVFGTGFEPATIDRDPDGALRDAARHLFG